MPGDGVGPEVTVAAVDVLRAAARTTGIDVDVREALIGGAAFDATGSPLPNETIDACRSADAVFLGAVGGPKWADAPVDRRPEAGLLGLRKTLGLFANLRPVRTLPFLAESSPLKPEKLANVDIMVVRELTGGIYFGKRERTATSALDTCEYTVVEIERVLRAAARLARARRGKVTSVDRQITGGWVRGSTVLTGLGNASDQQVRLDFQNEHLLARAGSGGSFDQILATTPDLLAVLDTETGTPITTEGLHYGQRATVVGIPCQPIWRSERGLELAGPRYFGWDIDYVPIEARMAERAALARAR